MAASPLIEVSYFPGCSLATSARESNQSLIDVCERIGLHLVEIDDWNCCGSSSCHSVDPELSLSLCARNLTLAPKGRPLMTMCPSCFRNLAATQHHLMEQPDLRRQLEQEWRGRIDPDLKIVTFLELLHFLDVLRGMGVAPEQQLAQSLKGLTIAPYYGCMTMLPPRLKRVHLPVDQLERQLRGMGAEVVRWSGQNRCCGTFLTATNPELTTPLINRIMQGALDFKADCLVTACAMCQLNIEIRCTLKEKIPIFHFTEIMALALGAEDYQGWFKRHLVDPVPLLRSKALIP